MTSVVLNAKRGGKVRLLHDGVLGEGNSSYPFKFGRRMVWLPVSQIGQFDDEEVTVSSWLVDREGLWGFEA